MIPPDRYDLISESSVAVTDAIIYLQANEGPVLLQSTAQCGLLD